MTISEAKHILSKPEFGNPAHIKALRVMEMVAEMGGVGAKVVHAPCEHCEGEGRVPCIPCDGWGDVTKKITEDTPNVENVYLDWVLDNKDDD